MISFEGLRIGGHYDRKHLAALWGYKSYEAISRGVVTPAGQPIIILFVEGEKEPGRSEYVDFIHGDLLFWEGERGHGNDDRIVSARNEGVEIHLFFRDLHRQPFEYRGPVLLTEHEIRLDSPSRFVFRILHDLSAFDDIASHGEELSRLQPTVRETVTLARLGQGEFRRRLIDLWTGQCAVTGVAFPSAMRASHIKPWRDSSNDDRLNRFNGLLLLPQYDHLFDRGYITFDRAGKIKLSSALEGHDLFRMGILPDIGLRFVHDDHRPYLEYHLKEIFLP